MHYSIPMVAVLLSSAYAQTTTASQAVASPWAQCGGQTFTGPTLCPSPQVCNKYSIYFPQCLPPCENGSGEYTCTSSSTAATSTSSLKATSTKTTLSTSTIVGTTSTPSYTTTPIVSITTSSAITYVTPWGQCGGALFTGSHVCPPPQVCNILNAFFSQCLPPCVNSAGVYTCTSSSVSATASA